MKRIISVLLVAVMLVSCMATVAFAAESATVSAGSMTVEAGKEYKVNVAISASTIDTYEIDVEVEDGLEVTAIDVVKYDNTMTDYTDTLDHVTLIGFDSFEATNLFTLTVKVAEDAKAGEYEVKLSGYASNADEDLNITFVNGVLTIEAPETEPPVTECPHTETEDGKVTKEPDCVNAGSQEIVCKACGVVVGTKELPALGHAWATEWASDLSKHWHPCTRCDVVADEAAHTDADWEIEDEFHYHVCEVCEQAYGKDEHNWVNVKLVEPVPDENCKCEGDESKCTCKDGYQDLVCKDCGKEWHLTIEGCVCVDPTGDISGIVTTGISALVIVLFSAVAIVIKRKTAI